MKKNPGGDLLLRDLSSDYHWRGSVSLPGSSSCLPGSPWGGFEGDFLRVVVCVAKKISSRYEGKESA